MDDECMDDCTHIQARLGNSCAYFENASFI